jgi:hypothetical protein
MGDRSQADAFAAQNSPEAIAQLNASFAEQVTAFNLIYDCAECVHVNIENRECSLAYPNNELWEAAAEKKALNENGDLVFCKYFEAH